MSITSLLYTGYTQSPTFARIKAKLSSNSFIVQHVAILKHIKNI